MTIELYNDRQSTCSQRVRMTLHEKELSFEEHIVDLMRGDQLTPAYKKINPNGVVPSIVHDGRAVIDSSVIMEYLVESFATGADLVPADALERAGMRSWMRFFDEVPAAAIRVPSYNFGFLRHFKHLSDEELQAFADAKPLRRDFFLRMGKTGFPKDELDKAMRGLQQTVDRMQAALGDGRPWLMGEQFTLADIMIMPVIVRLADLKLDDIWRQGPHVPAWLDRLRARPAFQAAYYHGSLLTEKYPGILEDQALDALKQQA
jgi:glutathione S-transferase